MKPKISVVIPAYNAEKYIADTLFSIDKQTLPPFEVIVVDDGSTDRTNRIVRWFFDSNGLRQKYRRMLLNHDENRGIGYGRQLGADKAGGDFVAYVMSDDTWHPTFLERSVRYLGKNIATFTQYYRCDQHMNIQRLFTEMPEQGLKEGKFRELVIEWALQKNIFVNSSCVIIPKRWFEKVCFEEILRTQEDIVFLLDTVIQGLQWNYVPEPLLYYRVHSQQVTRFQNKAHFALLWGHISARLNILGVSMDICNQAYLKAKKRTFPSLLRRGFNKSKRVLAGRLDGSH